MPTQTEAGKTFKYALVKKTYELLSTCHSVELKEDGATSFPMEFVNLKHVNKSTSSVSATFNISQKSDTWTESKATAGTCRKKAFRKR